MPNFEGSSSQENIDENLQQNDNFDVKQETEKLLEWTQKDIKQFAEQKIDIEEIEKISQLKINAIAIFAKHFEQNMTVYDKARLFWVDVEDVYDLEENAVRKRLIEYFGINEEKKNYWIIKSWGLSFKDFFGNKQISKYSKKEIDWLDSSLVELLRKFETWFEDKNWNKIPWFRRLWVLKDKKEENLKEIATYWSWNGSIEEQKEVEENREQREKEQIIDEINTFQNRLNNIKNDKDYINNTPDEQKKINDLLEIITVKIKEGELDDLREFLKNLNKDNSEYKNILKVYEDYLNNKNNKNKKIVWENNLNENIESNIEWYWAKVCNFILNNMVWRKYGRGCWRKNRDVNKQEKFWVDCSWMIIYAMRHFGLNPPWWTASSMFDKTKTNTLKEEWFSNNQELQQYKDKIKPWQILFRKWHWWKYKENYRWNWIHHVALVGEPAIVWWKLNIIEATPPKLRHWTINIDKIRKNKKHFSTIHIHDMDYS